MSFYDTVTTISGDNILTSVATSPNWILASGDFGDDYDIIDISNYSIVDTVSFSSDQTSLAISPDESRFASSDNSGNISIRDSSDRSETQSLSYGGKGIRYSSDGSYFASSGANENVRIWNTSDWSIANTFDAGGSAIAGRPDFSPDSTDIAYAYGSTLDVYDISSGSSVASVPLTIQNPTTVRWIPNEYVLIGESAGIDDGRISVVDTSSWSETTVLNTKVAQKAVNSIDYTENGEVVLAGRRSEITFYRSSDWTEIDIIPNVDYAGSQYNSNVARFVPEKNEIIRSSYGYEGGEPIIIESFGHTFPLRSDGEVIPFFPGENVINGKLRTDNGGTLYEGVLTTDSSKSSSNIRIGNSGSVNHLQTSLTENIPRKYYFADEGDGSILSAHPTDYKNNRLWENSNETAEAYMGWDYGVLVHHADSVDRPLYYYNADGSVKWSETGGDYVGFSVSSRGKFAAVDNSNLRVVYGDLSNGNFDWTAGISSETTSGGCQIDSSGNTYAGVNGSEVKQYDTSGTVQWTYDFGTDSNGDAIEPKAFCTDNTDLFAYADGVDGLQLASLSTSDGSENWKKTSLSGTFALSIATDGSHVFTSDRDGNFRKFDLTGTEVATASTSRECFDISLTPFGKLYTGKKSIRDTSDLSLIETDVSERGFAVAVWPDYGGNQEWWY